MRQRDNMTEQVSKCRSDRANGDLIRKSHLWGNRRAFNDDQSRSEGREDNVLGHDPEGLPRYPLTPLTNS